MADPLSHATQGALMMLGPFIAWIRSRVLIWCLVITGGLLGVLPDLLGMYGYVVRHDDGILYHSAHHGPVKDALKYIPMYALHLAVDSLTHDPDRQWYGWNVRVWLQLVLWFVNGVVIIWFVRIWRKNAAIVRSGRA